MAARPGTYLDSDYGSLSSFFCHLSRIVRYVCSLISPLAKRSSSLSSISSIFSRVIVVSPLVNGPLGVIGVPGEDAGGTNDGNPVGPSWSTGRIVPGTVSDPGTP